MSYQARMGHPGSCADGGSWVVELFARGQEAEG